MTKLSYAKAITRALEEAMTEDERVFCLGEDVGYGGAYGATQGLRDKFGGQRVRDTPISEAAIVGYSVGAAVAGLRPVAEIMHMDFITCAMDQVVNQAAKMRFMFGGKAQVPMVIRVGVGGRLNAAAQHSQSLESWFTHIPGLKVVAAGTPADVRALLLAAVRDDNPVLVCEALGLYETSGEVPDVAPELTLGIADTKRTGNDVTVVTWGGMVPITLAAADTLATEGISVEVIDLLSLMPWDTSAVLGSLERTGRLVIAHQAHLRSGFGAEVSATVVEEGFDLLDAPIVRVGSLNVPVPFSPALEDYVIPTSEDVAQAVRRLG
ncbi:MAG: alpha-ketoacid dehydrogenase subunit beta [Cryobacterium sp.]|nr:alpha-ketoacid dehydrogenase subunit beta [Cryobacterium sp.]